MGDAVTGLDAGGMAFADDFACAFEADRYGFPRRILRKQHVTAQITDLHSIPQFGHGFE